MEFDLTSVDEIPDLVRKVRNIGLLPLTVEADPTSLPSKEDSVSVFELDYSRKT